MCYCCKEKCIRVTLGIVSGLIFVSSSLLITMGLRKPYLLLFKTSVSFLQLLMTMFLIDSIHPYVHLLRTPQEGFQFPDWLELHQGSSRNWPLFRRIGIPNRPTRNHHCMLSWRMLQEMLCLYRKYHLHSMKLTANPSFSMEHLQSSLVWSSLSLAFSS